GSVEGHILESPTGANGFGYDPVFRPAQFEQSFAELNAETKNRLSHRGEATQALRAWLLEAASAKADPTNCG
ncbi:MAG: non-canonical purine NTP pyrophosphatase, partial [Chthoniobacterales bacterium]